MLYSFSGSSRLSKPMADASAAKNMNKIYKKNNLFKFGLIYFSMIISAFGFLIGWFQQNQTYFFNWSVLQK
jgi:hypothetical protein